MLVSACSSGTSGTASTRSDASGSGSAGAAKPVAGTDTGVLTTIDGARVRVPSGKPSVLAFISVGCADCAAAAKAAAQASQTFDPLTSSHRDDASVTWLV